MVAGIMYILWNRGIKGKIWRIIGKLNKDLKAKCRTGVRVFLEKNKDKWQGGVLSVTLFAKVMDTLSKRLVEDGRGPWFGGHLFPSLLLVNVAILAGSESDMERQLNTVGDFMMENRQKKCHKGIRNEGMGNWRYQTKANSYFYIPR